MTHIIYQIIKAEGYTTIKLTGSLTPEAVKEFEAEIPSLVAAKVILNKKGYGIKTALPSVVTRKDHTVLTLTKGLPL